MGRAMIVVVALALAVYCLVQVVQSRGTRVRLLPRWAWFLVILLLPIVGPIGWLWLGQPRQGRPPTRPQRRTIAPDDDPDFLRGLNWKLRRDPKKDE
jgi:cytochrome c-type biogenesis protein CcmH/NrfG